ncbi:MAG: peptidylprolyl isomerase, partial [Phycisphaerales bacterium]|nr:peptidylprolyl isomerase [Phycisphaerales bacterium]
LVRDQVTVTDQAFASMHDLIHGPKRQGRIIVASDLKAAQSASDRIRAGEDFAQVAVEMSIDSSALRGGLLEPISRADPAYPQAVRDVLWRLNQNETSDPVLVDNGYAILTLTRHIDGDGADLGTDRPALERLVRLSQERILMDQLARQLLSDTQVTVFDHSLHEQWQKQKRAGP